MHSSTPPRAASTQLPSDRLDTILPEANPAAKGIAVPLNERAGGVSAGKVWIAFEHDPLSVANASSGEGFIDAQPVFVRTLNTVNPPPAIFSCALPTPARLWPAPVHAA